jgi:hypothetical protein
MKKLTILMLVVVMILGLMLLAVGARDTVNKVTGEIWVWVEYLEESGQEESGHIEFDVHDREGEDKGCIYWYEYDDNVDTDIPWMISPVLCCNFVDENTAWVVVETEAEGVWIVLKVVDGGSPGADYDEVYFEYVFSELDDACKMVAKAKKDPSLEATIIGGNLIVHYYE